MPTWLFTALTIAHFILAIIATVLVMRKKESLPNSLLYLIMIWIIPIFGSLGFLFLNIKTKSN